MLETDRLILRNWQDSDLPVFVRMNSDPRVMEFFPSLPTREASDMLANDMKLALNTSGIGLFAVEVKNGAPFIGFIGLAIPKFTAHFTPCVEIGWRLAFPHWGKGYATEGAKAVLKHGFDVLKLPEIVSFTAAINMRSQAVMQKIGMTHNTADDFDHPHPSMPEGHPLKHHVLYRKNNS